MSLIQFENKVLGYSIIIYISKHFICGKNIIGARGKLISAFLSEIICSCINGKIKVFI